MESARFSTFSPVLVSLSDSETSGDSLHWPSRMEEVTLSVSREDLLFSSCLPPCLSLLYSWIRSSYALHGTRESSITFLSFINLQSVGQFTQSGPAISFGQYIPLLQGSLSSLPSSLFSSGVGWASGMMSAWISLFYNAVCAWSLVYLAYVREERESGERNRRSLQILAGQSYQWASCRNDYNTRCGDFRLNNH